MGPTSEHDRPSNIGSVTCQPEAAEIVTGMSRAPHARRLFLGGVLGSGFLLASGRASADAADTNYAFVDAQNTFTAPQKIQPSSDAVPLTLVGGGAGTSPGLNVQDQGGNAAFSITPSPSQPPSSSVGRISAFKTGSGHGPFVWDISGQTFNGTWDPVMAIGYNVSTPGAPILAGEPYAAMMVEGDYNDGVNRVMEQYFEHRTSASPSSPWVGELRPIMFQTKRDATAPEDFLHPSGIAGHPLQFNVPDNNQAGGLVTGAQLSMINLFEVYGHRPGNDTVLRLTAVSGQASKMFWGHNGAADVIRMQTVSPTQFQLSVGTGSFQFNQSGALTFPAGFFIDPNGTSLRAWIRFAGGSKEQLQIGGDGSSAAPTLIRIGTNATGDSSGIQIRSSQGIPAVGIGTDTPPANSFQLAAGVQFLSNGPLGFFGAGGMTQQVVSGSRGGNAALASLITALSNYGLVTDKTTA